MLQNFSGNLHFFQKRLCLHLVVVGVLSHMLKNCAIINFVILCFRRWNLLSKEQVDVKEQIEEMGESKTVKQWGTLT
jgi:hypothetical protein